MYIRVSFLRSAALFSTFFITFNIAAQNIHTIAGGGWNDDLQATAMSLMPTSVVTDQAGNLYITDDSYNRVIKVDAITGIAHIVAGIGTNGYNGDNIAAVNAQLSLPRSTAVDNAGNIYIADYGNSRIRKIDGSGIISTVAGNGGYGFDGDGGLAINAKFYLPVSVVVDNVGNLYISDQSNYRIRKVDAVTGIITTIAGTGIRGYAGDGGLAVNATIKKAEGLALDTNGDLYFADSESFVIRKITLSTGIITTVAGNGTSGSGGDGGLATAANIAAPGALCFGENNTMFIVSSFPPRVRMVNGTTGVISTIAGTGTPGYNGMTGVLTSLLLNYPSGIAVHNNNQIFIADQYNHFIRKVDLSTLQSSVIAGNGTHSYSGENGVVAGSQLSVPNFIKVHESGDLYISDSGNQRIFRIDGTTKVITSFAGIGINQFGGDGGVATMAQLNSPIGVAFDSQGNLYISDGNNHRVRKVNAVSKTMSSIAGNGISGHTGDNKLATSTALNYPRGIAIDADDNVYIADFSNNRIRKVNASNGFISTYAGTATGGYNGDNIPSATAQLKNPSSVCFDSDYNLYFADNGNNRIRRIDRVTGIITTVAGNGTATFSGDGGLATNAGVISPTGVFVDKYNTIYIAEQYRIRKVHASGIITTVAGDGTLGFTGDDGPAILAKVWPNNIAVDASGNIIVADGGNHRIRMIEQSATGQSITFNPIPAKIVGDTPFTPDAVATSQLPVAYASSNPAVAIVSKGQITIVGEGVATITASQPGNFNYTPATPVQQMLLVSLPPKSDQTITFGELETKKFGDPAFQLNASASSSLDIVYTSSDPSIVSIDGNTVSILGAGMVTITASQSGNASYNAATPVDQVLLIDKAEQLITFGELGTKTFGQPAFNLGASASSSLDVTYTSSDPTVVSIDGNIASILRAGMVTISASQSGNALYQAAPPVDQVLLVDKAEQLITFEALPAYTLGDNPFTLSASSTSGEPVNFSVNKNIVSLNNNIVTITGIGSVTITATQESTPNYLAATPVQQTICINPPKPEISISSQAENYYLESNASEGNQWFKDGNILEGATSNGLLVTESGAYSVATTIDGCQSIESDEQQVDIIILGVEEVSTFIKIYPNPVQDELIIDLSGQAIKVATAVIYDAYGRMVTTRSINASEPCRIDTRQFTPGLYVGKVMSGTNASTFTIVKR